MSDSVLNTPLYKYYFKNDFSSGIYFFKIYFLDYESRQIGRNHLINYHQNLILTVLFSRMNLAKRNI